MPAQKTLSIIGCGNVGRTLGRLWAINGTYRIGDILNRSEDSARRASDFIGAGRVVADYTGLQQADVFLIGAGDDQIAACCDALAATGRIGPGIVVLHCSGALPSSILKPALDRGALACSVHPIRSFASPEQVAANFSGTWCGVEGNADAVAAMTAAFTAIGASVVPIEAEFKTVYHAGAVFACNYLVTLLDVASQAYARSGIPPDDALRLMEPLVRETVDNVFRLGPAAALTGPIARGDLATAVRQYRAVKAWNTGYGHLYKLLGKITGALAQRKQRYQA